MKDQDALPIHRKGPGSYVTTDGLWELKHTSAGWISTPVKVPDDKLGPHSSLALARIAVLTIYDEEKRLAA